MLEVALLVLATVIVSVVAVLFAAFYFDLFVARSLLVGAVAGLFYLRLLARSVARLGGTSRQVGRFQLVVPIILIVSAARFSQLDVNGDGALDVGDLLNVPRA